MVRRWKCAPTFSERIKSRGDLETDSRFTGILSQQ
nr:MAG TPA: hypothetical protein [Caudoviricetes sp.]DAZ70273.1 MAG TPA: hypothetical protein [Caudoviricetes sp.]